MFKTIVWATDGSEAADEGLPFAKELAEGEDRTIVVVHSKEILAGRYGGWPQHVNEDELERKIRLQVDQLREDGFDVTFKLLTGAAPGAAHMIADAAREVGADVIVAGTRGHAPLAGLFLGSVTQRLLHVAPCPVLAVPPEKHMGVEKAGRETVEAVR